MAPSVAPAVASLADEPGMKTTDDTLCTGVAAAAAPPRRRLAPAAAAGSARACALAMISAGRGSDSLLSQMHTLPSRPPDAKM